MASEVGVPAAAARAKDLVWSLLRPGGPVDVETAANAAAEGTRCGVAVVARENAEPVRPEVVETAAVAAAMVVLRSLVRSQANNSALIYLVLAFAVGIAVLAELVCLWCR